MKYDRTIPIETLIQHKSLFLFGARQTGKSTLLKETFPEARYISLLEANTFREISARPELIRQSLKPEEQLIIIDEIQKLPELMDEVHLMIEQAPERRFILTGSSARSLKRGGANLLAGRAWVCKLHPLCSSELGFDRLQDHLTRGGLPSVIDSPFFTEDLQAYIGTYLQEEIVAEGLQRGIGQFSRFLEIAGLCSGEQLNFTAVANDTGVPAKVIREYYQILEDTLIGHLVPAYQKTQKRKALATARFYLFDVGIANMLTKRGAITPGSEAFGKALEHLIFLELRSYLDYRRLPHNLTYWRSRSGLEVDFVIGDAIGIEVKGTRKVHHPDYKGLNALAEEVPLRRRIIVANEEYPRQLDNGIEILPVGEFLRMLWGDGLL